MLDTSRGTAAVTRVLIDSTDGDRTWTTIGVSENVIEASWAALEDSIVFGLLHGGGRASRIAALVTQPAHVPLQDDRPGPAVVAAAGAAAAGTWTGRPSRRTWSRRSGPGSGPPVPTSATASSWPAGWRTGCS